MFFRNLFTKTRLAFFNKFQIIYIWNSQLYRYRDTKQKERLREE